LVRHGYKPTRDISHNPEFLESIQSNLRSYHDAINYAPNQVLLGNRKPDSLAELPRPWFNAKSEGNTETGPHGALVDEEQFYAILKTADDFDLIWLEQSFSAKAKDRLQHNPLLSSSDLEQISGVPSSVLEEKLLEDDEALPLTLSNGEVIGIIRRRLHDDSTMAPDILLENLAAKATATMAMRSVITSTGNQPEAIDYIVGSGEEAIGDRYNRGGGNLAKAVAEDAGCVNATGADVKAFCSAPVHAMIMAGSLIASEVYKNVAVVGGCSLAKLGMKYRGHLAKEIPILEDTLVGFAILMGPDDGNSPLLRLDSVGRHTVGSGSSQQQIIESLVQNPLENMNLRFTDIDKYATELQNPDITETVGTGNVPRTNYRLIAALASQRGEIPVGSEARDSFVAKRGLPGFSPTQGHVASAIPFLAHGLEGLRNGEYNRTMFLAKGSLFLGRMTQLSDGVSFVLEANRQR
jgi:betaine reductase